MKTLEFWTCINPDYTLSVPREVAIQIEKEQPVRVILLIPVSGEDQTWAQLTTDQFLKGYTDGDAVYDQLSAG
jgi:hypothetical protein